MAASLPRTGPGPGPLLRPEPPCSAPPEAPLPQAECRMVEVRGRQVASFRSGGSELLCLPQVFQLFLQHLVGGLHTVYTKLKRLRLSPVVCTVEQVRVLRGLGAIQPGVNRCKLISRADFETLYRDCTSASSRPGRPPKRSLGVANMTDGSRLLPHRLLSPALLSQTGLTAVSEALKLQKIRMMMSFQGDQENHDTAGGSEASWEKERLLPSHSSAVAPPAGSASLHLNTMHQRGSLLANRLSELPFMVLPHPILPIGLPPASVAMAMNQMTQLRGLSNMAAVSQTEDSSKASPPGIPSYSLSLSEEELRPQELTSQSPSRESSSPSASPPILTTHTPELDDGLLPLPLFKPTYEKLALAAPPLSNSHTHSAFAPLLLAEGLSSTETLLTNIQGLLKVAAESARCQHTHSQQERKELKLELERERDARQNLQRHLSSQLHATASIQKRLRKEKRLKRRLQEALDFEWRRREEVQRALKHCDTLTGAVSPESPHGNKQEI
ncbi:dachshund homolog 2-like [Salarias fasciatus]|uniref:dachshund homolog 2-like n=1 Tax=Salarias fasciatus TaxID=181472 RepID=UPI001176EC46|nr:dachshund homolog 2-like [Salarias fasciatus]